MRRRIIPIAARVLGVLCALFVIWLVRPRWLPVQMVFYAFFGQAAALYAFVGFLAPISATPVPPASESEPEQNERSRKDIVSDDTVDEYIDTPRIFAQAHAVRQ